MIRLCSYNARHAVEMLPDGSLQPFAAVTLITAESNGGLAEQFRNISIAATPAALRQIAETLLTVAEETEDRAKDMIHSKDDA